MKANKPTEEELKVFEEYWKPRLYDKKGLNKTKLIKELFLVKEATEVEQIEACYISTRSVNLHGKTYFAVIADGKHYVVTYSATDGQLNSGPALPLKWHHQVLEGIRKILQGEAESVIVIKN